MSDLYLHHFGLQRSPFSIAPDPRFLFMSERHREALAHLRFGLDGGGGFVVLTGEIGAGKTTVCRCLLEQVPPNCKLAYLFNPKLTVRELLQSICADFGIPSPRAEATTASIKDYIDALNAHLLASHAAGQHNVLIIDEAQSLAPEVLEQLRLLTNLETHERKLLQIVLIGQPELRSMLARPELEQLAQRVVARYHLGTLSREETEQYILHRLAVAGAKGANPFDRSARARLFALSGGVPRRVNLLADRALLGAYAEGAQQVSRRIIDKAAREVAGDDGAGSSRRRRLAWAGAAVGGVAAAALVAWLGLPQGRDGAAAADKPAARALTSVVTSPASSTAESTTAAAGGAAAAASAAPAASAVAAAADAGDAAATKTVAAPDALAALPWAGSAELSQALPLLVRDEAQAWRELAPHWKLAPLAGAPCAAARAQQVHCIKRRGSLDLLRRMDRPAILPLYAGNAPARFVQVLGIDEGSLALRLGGRTLRVRAEDLTPLWRGEFGTYWRAPAPVRVDANGLAASAGNDWLAQQLAQQSARSGTPSSSADMAEGDTLRAAVRAFQRSQGLQADGLAGIDTLMVLQRALGDDEPHLLH